MARSLLRLFCLSSLLATILSTFNYDDGMGRMEKSRIIYLSEDLFKDSMLKLRQIIEVRKEHEDFISYNIGMIIGRIREKYKFMVETYRELYDKQDRKSDYLAPGSRGPRPIHHIIALEMMHYLSIEIDKLVEILEQTAVKDMKSANFLVGRDVRKQHMMTSQKPKLRSGGATDLRSQNETTTDLSSEDSEDKSEISPAEAAEIRRLAMIEVQKSNIRQEYLMKKIGQPTNMTTTRKRFVNKWPVEETWDINKYHYYNK